MEVGLIGEFVVKLVELELKQERVWIQHQQMEELNVQERQLKIVTHKREREMYFIQSFSYIVYEIHRYQIDKLLFWRMSWENRKEGFI